MDKKTLTVVSVCLVFSAPAAGDESVDIVGSSTVYPFSAVAAERFSQISGQPAPKVEATGSGGGIKLFCAGLGSAMPDVVNASRRMKKSEQENCRTNGVDNILEVKIGYDGIVVARSVEAAAMTLSRKELFLALARDIPDGVGGFSVNPNKTWRDINSGLPDLPIRVYGPPPTSGTRDAFSELVMEKGCLEFDDLRALKKTDRKKFKAVCHALREDGAYIESGENDNIIIQKLRANPDSAGIFGFSFMDENRDKVQGLAIENIAPEFETIAAGAYPVSRPLFFYAKLDHYPMVDGLQMFVEFFASPEVMGADGFLSERGLIPLSDGEYAETAAAVAEKRHMPRL